MLSTAPAPSAGGAQLDEVIVAAAIGAFVTLPVAYVVLRERLGRTTLVGRLADKVAQWDGLPRWAGLPAYLTYLSVIVAGFGVWWDVPIHMQNGRDEGPLANPSHYFIYLGLLGFLNASILSMGLARDPLPRNTVRFSRTWRVPYGPLVIFAAGLIAVLGFPADDVWHRLFGQDVTEWGPTHVMMIGGAVTCFIGLPLLHAEATQVGARGTQGRGGRLRGVVYLGSCIIPYAFLMEFELGIPQFPAVTEFIIAGVLLGWIMVVTRLWFGRGGALIAAAVYLVHRSFLYFSVAALPGVLTARFLLFVPAAVLVEVVALLLPPARRRTAFALVSAVAVGTLGLLAEWVWTRIFFPMPQPFPASSLPLLIAAGTVAAVGGSLVALWHMSRLEVVAAREPVAQAPGGRRGLPYRGYGLAGLAVFVVLMGIFAPQRAGDEKIGATVDYADATFADGSTGEACDGERACSARVIVRFDDPLQVQDAIWLYAFGWQGRGPEGRKAEAEQGSDAGGVYRTALDPTGEPGEYRAELALPLHGSWKSMIRIHKAPSTLVAIPLHFPEDKAITSAAGREIMTEPGEHLIAQPEPKLLQRETKDDVPRWLWTTGYLLVLMAWIGVLLAYGWCYNRAAGARVAPRESASSQASVPSAPAGRP